MKKVSEFKLLMAWIGYPVCTVIGGIGFIGLAIAILSPYLQNQVAILDDKMVLAKILVGSILFALAGVIGEGESSKILGKA